MTEEFLDQFQDRYFLSGVIERFEDKRAVIVTADNQIFFWPIKDLPSAVQVGTKVRIVLTTSQTDQAERELVAKTILNKILKNSADENRDDK